MIRVSSPENLEAVCARAAAAKLDHLPLFRAAADGQIALALISTPASKWPGRANKHLGPHVILIQDDPYPKGTAVGPAGWACLRGAQRWARFVVAHGTGSAPEHYRAASALALLHRRVLFIETDSTHVEEWAGCFDVPVMRFLPPAGCVHPSPRQEIMN